LAKLDINESFASQRTISTKNIGDFEILRRQIKGIEERFDKFEL
jgi:hypothetical protein